MTFSRMNRFAHINSSASSVVWMLLLLLVWLALGTKIQATPAIHHDAAAAFKASEAYAVARAYAPAPIISPAGFQYGWVRAGAAADEEALWQMMREAGFEAVDEIPGGIWLVRRFAVYPSGRGDFDAIEALPIPAEFRLDPALRPLQRAGHGEVTQPVEVLVHLWPGEPVRAMAEWLAGEWGVQLTLDAPTVPEAPAFIASVEPAVLAAMAGHPSVRRIEPRPIVTLRNDSTTAIVQSGVDDSRPYWQSGLRGRGQVVGHIDRGIHLDSCYLRDGADTPVGPNHRKVVAYRGMMEANEHGTHTAATAVGLNFTGSVVTAGHAPDARLSHTNGVSPVSLRALFDLALADGAAIHTNSWGVDNISSYTGYCRDIDAFTYDNESALVIFAVSNRSTIHTPENAKNVLATAPSRRSPNQHAMWGSARGPTADGRRKPELTAPGEAILSASAIGCGRVTLSGSSMAAPAVAGAAAVVRQYFMDGWYPLGASPGVGRGFMPSGALLRAVLLQAGEDMTGEPGFPASGLATDPANRNREGFGRLLLTRALPLPSLPRRLIVRDAWRTRGEGLATGGMATMTFDVLSADIDLRIALAWHDPPAAIGSTAPVINQLDLEVIDPLGRVFRGNAIESGVSLADRAPDPINTVELVMLPAPAPGRYEVRVLARRVSPLFGGGRQGYAVAISGAVVEPLPPRLTFPQGLAVGCQGIVPITLEDSTLASGSRPEIAIQTTSGDVEIITLQQMLPGVFGGSLTLGLANGSDGDLFFNGIVEGRTGDALVARYPANSPEAVATLEATFDCDPPQLLWLEPEASDTRAHLRLEASEPVQVFARFWHPFTGAPFVRETVLEATDMPGLYAGEIVGLRAASLHVGWVQARDAAGNVTTLGDSVRGTGPPLPLITGNRLKVYAWPADDGIEPIPGAPNPDTASGASADGWRLAPAPWSFSGQLVWFVPNVSATGDHRLTTPAITLPDALTSHRLEFRQTYAFDQTLSDGGVVEISNDDGATWHDLGPHITRTPYSGAIIPESPTQTNPLAGRPAYVAGVVGSPALVYVDLTPWAGQTVRLRWRFGSDAIGAATGWYVDGIAVTAVEPGLMPGTRWYLF